MRLTKIQKTHQEAFTWLLDEDARRSGRSILMVVCAMRLSICQMRPVLVNDHGTAAGSWYLRDALHMIAEEYRISVSLNNYRVSVDVRHNRDGLERFLEDTAPDSEARELPNTEEPKKSVLEVLKKDF